MAFRIHRNITKSFYSFFEILNCWFSSKKNDRIDEDLCIDYEPENETLHRYYGIGDIIHEDVFIDDEHINQQESYDKQPGEPKIETMTDGEQVTDPKTADNLSYQWAPAISPCFVVHRQTKFGCVSICCCQDDNVWNFIVFFSAIC